MELKDGESAGNAENDVEIENPEKSEKAEILQSLDKSLGKSTEESPEAKNLRYFKTKKIRFGPIEYQIVTQNINGPCPLIALINALVLKGKLTIPSSYVVTSTNLLNLLTNVILARAPPENDEKLKETFEANLGDVMNIMETLVNGLDVNVKFSAVDTFEFTPALSLFDLVSVNLYHVWLPDPQFTVLYDLIRNLNYNELVEKMCGDQSTETELLRTFYDESISQITFHGLASLMERMKDGELAVVFHNNHFSTILKRRDEIFKLVSDEGLCDEPNIVWETFSSVDGDCIFVNGDFGNFKPITPPTTHPSPESFEKLQISDNSPIEQGIEAVEHTSAHHSAPVSPQHRAPAPPAPQTARAPPVTSPTRNSGAGGKSCLIM